MPAMKVSQPTHQHSTNKLSLCSNINWHRSRARYKPYSMVHQIDYLQEPRTLMPTVEVQLCINIIHSPLPPSLPPSPSPSLSLHRYFNTPKKKSTSLHNTKKNSNTKKYANENLKKSSHLSITTQPTSLICLFFSRTYQGETY